MRTKNTTPFLVGTKLCSRRPPQPEMTIVVRGTFALAPSVPVEPLKEQGRLTSEVFADDDDERAGACLYGGDFAAFKLHGEVTLTGTCHTPGGGPLTECPVKFSVGEWSKSLLVTGRRVWSDGLPGAVASAPIAFASMPLGYDHAFGGPGYARNPAGKGYKTVELPNVEDVRQRVRSRGDTPEPAGFGPLNPAWPSRAGKVGTAYGKSYREKRFPYFADDFDWTHFNAAPSDQQLTGYLEGDEELGFVNLHPAAPSFTARLPALRVRAFVTDVEHAFREVPIALDTLHADLDRGVLVLTWRGVTPVQEDDFADVTTLVVSSEPLADRPLAASHYAAVLAAFERDPYGLKERLPAEVADLEGLIAAHATGEPAPGTDSPPPSDLLAALVHKKLGDARAADQERLAATMEELKATLRKADPKADIDGAVARIAALAEDQPPIAVPIKPGVLPDLRLREQMRKVMGTVEVLKKAAALQKVALPDAVAKLEELPRHPKLIELDPTYTPPGPVSTDEPGPGRDLSEQDLSRRDLRGFDLTGAKLDGAILVRADLRGAKLAGASLRRAVLFRADLTGADLTGADLTQVNAAELRAPNADLRGARLDIGYFKDADLSGALLEGAAGEYVVFHGANLSKTKASKARFDHSDFRGGSLEKADLRGASLIGCEFAACSGANADLSGAAIAKARFRGADFSGAALTRVRGPDALFLGTNLDGADLRLAVLAGADASGASLVGANAFGADLRRSRLRRTNLERANLERANLFEADLAKARLGGTRLRKANLYGANLLGAGGADCDLLDANLEASTLEPR